MSITDHLQSHVFVCISPFFPEEVLRDLFYDDDADAGGYDDGDRGGGCGGDDDNDDSHDSNDDDDSDGGVYRDGDNDHDDYSFISPNRVTIACQTSRNLYPSKN